MTPSEAAKLLTFESAVSQRTISEIDAKAWASVLVDVRLDDAIQAVQNLWRTVDKRLVPLDILTEVKRIRAARFTAEPGYEQPPAIADPDDVAGYLAALREQRRAVADGREPLPAIEPPKVDRTKELADKLAVAEKRQEAVVGVRKSLRRRAEHAATRKRVSDAQHAARESARAELDALRAKTGANT